MDKIHEYSNGELTIIWQPNICQHAGICVKMLPKVYNPKERPWIKIENATTAELIDQIGKCPSGALTYRMEKKKEEQNYSSNTPSKQRSGANPILGRKPARALYVKLFSAKSVKAIRRRHSNGIT